jgi:hypothetical protein
LHSVPSVFTIVDDHFRTHRDVDPSESLWHVTAHPDDEMFPSTPSYVATKSASVRASKAVLSRPAKCWFGSPWHCVHWLLSVRSPAEESDAVWFSPLTDPVRAWRPDQALFHSVAAAWLAAASAAWHAVHCVDTSSVCCHPGVAWPPWQETFEHVPLSVAGE